MDLFRPSSPSEKLKKIEAEMVDEEGAPAAPERPEGLASTQPEQDVISSRTKLRSLMQKDARSRYTLAETQIIDRLAIEFQSLPRRDIALRNQYGSHVFDAAFENQKGLTLVEIKVFTERSEITRRIREVYAQIREFFDALPDEAKRNTRFILAVAYEMSAEKAARVEQQIKSKLAGSIMPIEVRMYDMNELIENVFV